MNFDWTVSEVFTDIPEREYINDCCIGGDEILNRLKSEIASQMGVDLGKVTIYQEDWGWALEFSKDEVFYLLGLNNNYEGGDKTEFTINIEANKRVKKFLFTKSVEATEEVSTFSKVLNDIAKNSGFQVGQN